MSRKIPTLKAINEALGMTYLEAQAAGLPVVCGDSRGGADIVADGETGLLAPLGDAPAFAKAVEALLAEPARRARLGAAAAAKAAAEHDVGGAARVLDDIFRRAVQGHGP